jgi:hypothetical protein
MLMTESDTTRVLKSDDGLSSLTLAGKLPVNILMSGPARGVAGVADIVARNTPYKDLITLDTGGTSTDCALIYKGQPQLQRETTIDNLSVRSRPSTSIPSDLVEARLRHIWSSLRTQVGFWRSLALWLWQRDIGSKGER